MSDFKRGERVCDARTGKYLGTFKEYRVVPGYDTSNGKRTVHVMWDGFPDGGFCSDDSIRRVK